MRALPDMFYYLDDPAVPISTSGLEGYFSRLKRHYRQHRGLSKLKLKSYFQWYHYFCKNNHTFLVFMPIPWRAFCIKPIQLPLYAATPDWKICASGIVSASGAIFSVVRLVNDGLSSCPPETRLQLLRHQVWSLTGLHPCTEVGCL